MCIFGRQQEKLPGQFALDYEFSNRTSASTIIGVMARGPWSKDKTLESGAVFQIRVDGICVSQFVLDFRFLKPGACFLLEELFKQLSQVFARHNGIHESIVVLNSCDHSLQTFSDVLERSSALEFSSHVARRDPGIKGLYYIFDNVLLVLLLLFFVGTGCIDVALGILRTWNHLSLEFHLLAQGPGRFRNIKAIRIFEKDNLMADPDLSFLQDLVSNPLAKKVADH